MRVYSKKADRFLLPVLAFFLTSGVLCIVYFWFGLFPFGEKTLAWGDMKQQVIPLMLEFKDILAGKAGFFLNFQNAGGMSFWGVFFFFLSSPFTFLAAFLEKRDIYFFVNVLVMVKLALAALTASFFFKEDLEGLDRRLHLFCCVSYGLCGYGLLYYQNIVWLDVLYLFPVLMTGFRRVIHSRKGLLFTVSLTAIVAVNYYLSYMVFLALILMSALFLRNCVPAEKRGETAGKVGECAIISLLLTAIVWLPSLLQCMRSARVGGGLAETIREGGLFPEISTTLPVLLCTAAATALPALKFLFPNTPKRKTLIFLFYLTAIPLVLEPINKMWHTGSYQAFPARYGYIPVFLALWCVGDFFNEGKVPGEKGSKKLPESAFAVITLFILAAVGAVILIWNFKDITSYTRTLWFDGTSFMFLLLFSLLASLAVWLGAAMWHRGKISRTVLGWMLLSVCLIQGGFHAAVLIGSAAGTPEKGKAVLTIEGTLPDDGFYRVKQDSKFCDVNLIGAAGFPTLNHYTSLTDENFLHAVKKLGYSSYWMETSACCGTEFSDILLSNRYSLTGGLEWRKTGAGYLGYILPAGTLPEALGEGNRFSLQDDLYKLICTEGQKCKENAFIEYRPREFSGLELKKSGGETSLRKLSNTASLRYTVQVTDRETLYFDAFGENTNHLKEKINDSFCVSVNGSVIAEGYPSQSRNGILELGSFECEEVSIEISVKQDVDGLKSFGVYGLKRKKLDTAANQLKSGNLHTEKSRILGSVNTEQEGEALFLSIPYSPGMKFTVNGCQVHPRIVLDCFLEIPLEKGENTLEVSMVPQGVKLGALLSTLGVLFAIMKLLFRNRGRGKTALLWNKIAEPSLKIAFYGVLLLIYFSPTAVWFTGLL